MTINLSFFIFAGLATLSFSSAFAQLNIPLEGMDENATLLNYNQLQVKSNTTLNTYSISGNGLNLSSSENISNCSSTVAKKVKLICAETIEKNVSDILDAAPNIWKCASKGDVYFKKPIVDKKGLEAFLKNNKLNKLSAQKFIDCIENVNKIVTYSPTSTSCIDKSQGPATCSTTSPILSFNFVEGFSSSFPVQVNFLCGIPKEYAANEKLLNVLGAESNKGIDSSLAAELLADKVQEKSANIPKTLACQGCGKLVQQIQKTSDPALRSQLVKQFSERISPAIQAAFGPSAAYAGSSVSRAASISNASENSRLPANSIKNSALSSGSNLEAASPVRQNFSTDTKSEKSSSLGTPTADFAASETEPSNANTFSSGQAELGRAAATSPASSNNSGGGSSAGVASSSGGVSASAPASDTFLGSEDLTPRQQTLKQRVSAAPTKERAKLVQTRQLNSELANNGIQVRFTYKSETAGVPKNGSPEIIWIIDRQGNIQEIAY